MAGCIVIRAAFAICACSLIIACDAISSEKGSPPDDETIDRLNRERVEERKRDVELVREYRSWQDRLRATDHASLGLPLDDTFGPVTADSRFCERLPSQPVPSPERLAAEYREHADRFRAAVFPEDEKSYRAHYFAERHMTRLACLVRLGGEQPVLTAGSGHVFLDERKLLHRSIMYDFLHPTVAGYQIWAEAIGPTVIELMKTEHRSDTR